LAFTQFANKLNKQNNSPAFDDAHKQNKKKKLVTFTQKFSATAVFFCRSHLVVYTKILRRVCDL